VGQIDLENMLDVCFEGEKARRLKYATNEKGRAAHVRTCALLDETTNTAQCPPQMKR